MPSVILRPSIAGAALALVLTALPAQAQRMSFDGPWSVLILADQGSCQGATYRYGVQIANGQVFSQGSGADIFGRVTPRGQVSVRLRQGSQEAVGSGRLTQVSGSGYWSGASPGQQCAGRWIAERRSYYY
ncbi:MAG: hypothetical protein QOF14_278 [Hyphomicrobiales bacterium]|jgi:hypothetical protein|nr:hypothetical protein [Hyphomicrobiales bacterium]